MPGRIIVIEPTHQPAMNRLKPIEISNAVHIQVRALWRDGPWDSAVGMRAGGLLQDAGQHRRQVNLDVGIASSPGDQTEGEAGNEA
jgi:hypothetical protein